MTVIKIYIYISRDFLLVRKLNYSFYYFFIFSNECLLLYTKILSAYICHSETCRRIHFYSSWIFRFAQDDSLYFPLSQRKHGIADEIPLKFYPSFSKSIPDRAGDFFSLWKILSHFMTAPLQRSTKYTHDP